MACLQRATKRIMPSHSYSNLGKEIEFALSPSRMQSLCTCDPISIQSPLTYASVLRLQPFSISHGGLKGPSSSLGKCPLGVEKCRPYCITSMSERCHAGIASLEGLGTASKGAAWSAGFDFLPIEPFLLLSIASVTQSATSLSTTPTVVEITSVTSLACSSSASEMVGGFNSGASQAWRNSIAYVGRSLGILFKQPRIKSLAASEKPSPGRSGGSPSTIA